MNAYNPFTGALLGVAVGDALGLPRENLSPRRAARLFGEPLRHRFVFGRGMTSDDLEHACMTAQALLAADDVDRFARSLAWRLRGWLLGLPAGIGSATLRSCLRLWLGFSPSRSGVWSAGNGPAMRAPILGVCLGRDPAKLSAFVRAATRLTHTDPRAEQGSLLIAVAAHVGAANGNSLTAERFFQTVRTWPTEWSPNSLAHLARVEEHLRRGDSAVDFARALGLERGVSGFIEHTLPVVLFCWLRNLGDFRRSLDEVIRLGGDADTTGAIVGGLAGATLGPDAIPAEWLTGLFEWPRSVRWLRRLGERLARHFEKGEPNGPLPLFWPALLPRNLFFLLIVLVQIARRMLPPY